MTVYLRKSGRYTARIDETVNGKRKHVSLGTFARKKDAEKAERDAIQRREQGATIASERYTLDALFERFMTAALARDRSGTTLHEYRAKWSLYVAPRIGSIVADKLKPVQLVDLYSELRNAGGRDRKTGVARALSSRTVGHVATLIRTVLTWAYRLELVQRNVADLASPPPGARKKAVPYQQDEAERLLAEAMKVRNGPLVAFAFQTGLRRGELCALRWSDIDFSRRTMLVSGSIAQIPKRSAAQLGRENTWYKATKTDAVQTIALSDVAIEALELQRILQAEDRRAAGPGYRDEGFVFAPPLGRYTTPGALGNAVRRIAVRAGLETKGIHSTRHSTGSFLLADGVDPVTVSSILRHSATSTTLNIYGHVLTGAQAKAVDGLSKRLGSKDRYPRPTPEREKTA